MRIKLSFLGAAGTVTGSKYLLERAGRRILVDCGLFQGYKQLRLRNWAPPPVDPRSIDAVILTHAHIDHSGYLPVLAKQGFGGKVFCSRATRELSEILLPDSAPAGGRGGIRQSARVFQASPGPAPVRSRRCRSGLGPS